MSRFWKIEESVGRYYILLEGIFTTREAAEREIATTYKGAPTMRAAEYEIGMYEPRRVKELS